MNARIKERIEQINSGIVPEGYQKTAFGIFPCDWLKVSLGEVSSKKGEYGLNAPACEYAEGLPKYLRITDIDEQGCYIDNNAYVNDTDSNKYILGKGDIVFARTGASVGKNYIYNEKDGILVYAGFLIKFSIKPQYNAYLICLNCRTKKYDNWVAKMCARSGQPGINAEEYATYSCIIPKSTQEQARIAEILMQWDKAIEMQGKLGEAYQKLKKYCLNKMFPKKGSNVPEIRFPGFTAPWEQRKLGDMGKTFTGLSGKSSVDFGHGDGRFVTYMNVFTNAIANPEMVEPIEIDSKQSTVKYGDIFFTTSSETPEEVGMSSIWLENTPNTYLNSFCFGFRLQTDLDYVYMAYALRSDTFRTKIILLAQGISRYNISKNKVMDIDSVFPSIMEQKQIGEFFLNLDNIITLHQKKREKLVAQRKILQQYLLTGIVRV